MHAEAPVIGLAVNGQARAYLVWGMSQPAWHLAHDELGDWKDCARVLERGEVPADEIQLAGFADFS